MLELIPVKDIMLRYDILYELLKERTPDQSISHKCMPEYEEHIKFVDNHPYLAWYFVIDRENEGIVGSVYLTRYREIGVSIFRKHHGKGYGTHAIDLLMTAHPGRFLANINPQNHASIRFFKKLGFKHIQNTYELEN